MGRDLTKSKMKPTKYLSFAFFTTVMLFTASALVAQVKIGSNPTTIGSNNNLEVESSTGKKTSIHKGSGKVTIKDGTEGLNRVLTSDAVGVASWKSQQLIRANTVLACQQV